MQTDFANAPEVREASQLVASMTALATGYRVTTAVQYSDGGEQLKKVKGAQNRLETLRQSITRPLNAALKSANDLFREPAQRLFEAEKAIKGELSRYAEEQDRIRRDEQARADAKARQEQERIEAQARRAAEAGKPEKAAALEQRAAAVQAPIIQREAPKIVGVSLREVPKFEITDPMKVPREYLTVDEKKIGGVVRALKMDANIPGVRVWMEKQVASGAA